MRKNYMLVDLFSGSYVKEHKGNEDLNDKRNKVTGKYYGYVPSQDTVNIKNLGASKKDKYIDDILVVFVKKHLMVRLIGWLQGSIPVPGFTAKGSSTINWKGLLLKKMELKNRFPIRWKATNTFQFHQSILWL